MATNETTRDGSGGALKTISQFVGILVGIATILAIYVFVWPQIKATYYATPTAQPTQPAADTSALDRLKAENAAMRAQLNAAPAAPQSAPIIVQQVPAGQAPQPLVIPEPAAPPADSAAPAAEPAPRPLIVVVRQNDSGQTVVTGSGACKVGGSVAKRCAK